VVACGRTDYSTTSMRRMTWYPSREEQFCVVLARMLDPVQPAKLDKALQVSITAQNISEEFFCVLQDNLKKDQQKLEKKN